MLFCVNMLKIRTISEILLFFLPFITSEHIWHSFKFDPKHRSPQELQITNLTHDNDFKLDYKVTQWKSIQVEKICYAAGLMESGVIISSIQLNPEENRFVREAKVIELGAKPVDVAVFQHWNKTTRKVDVIAVIPTQRAELHWYKITNLIFEEFWQWPVDKNITHVNIFQINYNYHLLKITDHRTHISADLYEFQITPHLNFWMRQAIPLFNSPKSSALSLLGPDYFLSIPQKSLNVLQVYKLSNNHFISYRNISSQRIDDVISFNVGHKPFIAINGLNAGIYQFTPRNALIRRTVLDTNLDGVHYWLPIQLNTFPFEIILMAQRFVDHGEHKSFVIDIITYNGVDFEEHEDVNCLYFGENTLGLSCLPGEENERGIIGATSISLGNVLGLLIPRDHNASELFIAKTSIRKMPNPVEEEVENLNKRRKYLQNLMVSLEEQVDNLLKSDQARAAEEIDGDSSPFRHLEDLNGDVITLRKKVDLIKNLETQAHFKTVTFNGVVEVKEANFDEIYFEKIEDEVTAEVLSDIVLKNDMKPVTGHKIVNNLQVEHLVFKNINNISSKDLLFNIDNHIVIDGDVILTEPLTVFDNVKTGLVNGEVLEDQVLQLRETINKTIHFENLAIDDLNVENFDPNMENTTLKEIELEDLHVTGNIQVENLNGENFNDLLRKICMTNIRTYVPGTMKITGNVIVEGNMVTSYLNGLEFPKDYVFLGENFSNITARKIFANSLSTYDLVCDGTLDGVDFTKVIRLDKDDQYIPGTVTFNDLEVTEGLEVKGQVVGDFASKFLPNPSFVNTSLIKSNVHFKELEVDGYIIITADFNGQKFQEALSDVIYKGEDNVTITSIKEFSESMTVRENLEITSNRINDIDLNSLVTKDTDQVLNMSTINGGVDFNNVQTTGLFNSVNITQLDQVALKLTGDQYIASTVTFEDIEFPELEVLGTINGLNPENFFQETPENLGEIEFGNVEVYGDFNGNISGFDLAEFDDKRLSRTKEQTITGEVYVNNSNIETLYPNMINGNPVSLLQKESIMDRLKDNLTQGKIKIKHFYVNGSVDIDRINNVDAINLPGCLWNSKSERCNPKNFTIMGIVHFSELNLEKLGDVNFTKFTNDLIFKNDTDVKIYGTKIFTKGFRVRKLIETEKLNSIPIDQILTKHGDQEIVGPLTIQGDVYIDNDSEINGTINDIPVEFLQDNYQLNGDEFTVKGDLLFTRLTHIDNLVIQGLANGKPLQKLLDSIVYQDSDFKLKGEVVFEDQVNIAGNVRIIGKINDISLANFVSNIVMTTKDATITGPVRFLEAVNVTDNLFVLEDIESDNITGIDFDRWMKEAVFVDRGMLKGNFNFERATVHNNLQTDFLNEIDMRSLVPLRSKQHINELYFDEIMVFHDIDVGNSTSGYYLPEEFANTLMTNTDQNITGNITFRERVFVDGDIKLSGLINGVDLSQIVTTGTDQNLTAGYHFKSTAVLAKDLVVDGLVNGINISNWYNNGVKVAAPYVQNITNYWEIDRNLVFEDDVAGEGLINGYDLKQFSEEIEYRRLYKYKLEKGFIDDYTNMCKDLTFMYDKMKKQIYKFSYLEMLQDLQFPNQIHFTHTFQFDDKYFMMIGEKYHCEAHIFVLSKHHFKFTRNVTIGQVSQIITVQTKDSIYFVTRNQPSVLCDISGTNLWQLEDYELIPISNIEDQKLLQSSLIPGTFYGLSHQGVTEFRIVTTPHTRVVGYRKWQVPTEDAAFVPHGLATGLALRTRRLLINLNRADPIVEDDSIDVETIIRGNFTFKENHYLPGRRNNDLVVVQVGSKSTKRRLLAVASHEETSIGGSIDFIKIYEDAILGIVFHKVPTYKPSSLISLEFNNGETLLAFLEDRSVLQVYEYKGIAGFKHRLSAKLAGSRLFEMTLALYPFRNERKVIGLIDKNRVRLIEARMLGNQIEKNLKCLL